MASVRNTKRWPEIVDEAKGDRGLRGAAAQREGLLTRAEVAGRLGITKRRLRQLEDEGAIRPARKGSDGRRLYTEAEVARVAAKRGTSGRTASTGELAALVFERFERGEEIGQIVRELRQPPAVVRALYHEWSTPLTVSAEWARRERALAIERAERRVRHR